MKITPLVAPKVEVCDLIAPASAKAPAQTNRFFMRCSCCCRMQRRLPPGARGQRSDDSPADLTSPSAAVGLPRKTGPPRLILEDANGCHCGLHAVRASIAKRVAVGVRCDGRGQRGNHLTAFARMFP